MVDYLPRSAWDARPARSGPGNLTVSRVEGVTLHWPGMENRRLSSQAAVAAALRGWQDYHMDTKDWSDIAYQVAVDQAGRAWTLRGLHTQSGANGDNDVNERYGAILLVLGTGEHPTPAMVATTRAVVDDFRELYPDGTAIKPHSAVRPEPTDCPGDLVRALIAHDVFDPDMPISTPTHPQEDEMTPAQMTELKNFIEARTQAYALANNEYVRQLTQSQNRALVQIIRDSDEAQAERILAELEDEATQLSASTLKAVPAAEVEQAS